MPRAGPPSWKLRKEPILDNYVQASIDAVNGIHDPDTGHYGTLVYAGIETRERALEIKQSLFRCAYYMHSHKIADVSMSAEIKKAKDGTFNVEFRAINKQHARAYLLATKGEDRSKWAYDPRKKNVKE